MLQIRCDICGKTIDMNNKDSIFVKVNFQPVYHFRSDKPVCLTDIGIKNGCYDLYDVCGKTLSKFLNGGLGVTKV